YGYHIVQVMEKESSRMRPFEEVKAELAGERRTQLIGERLGQLADQARTELAKNPQQAQEIAKRLGIDFARVDSAGRGDPLPEIGVNDDFAAAVFGTAKGTVSGVVQVAGNKYAVAAVREVNAPGQAALEDVQAQIRSQLQDTASYRLANDRGAEMANKQKAPGADFNAIAKAMKAEVKTSAEMTREADLPGIGTVATMSELFKQPVGATGGPYNIGGKIVVARLAWKAPPDMSKLDAERPRLLTELRQRSGRERKELFEDGIVTRLIDEGKIKINDAAVKRLISSYRS
ncbi:MAG: peptidyl-prolyl cis-trans isomerase, partial [Bryobacteraceae bacterium]